MTSTDPMPAPAGRVSPSVLLIGLATILLVIVGVRFGLPVYRQYQNLRRIEHDRGHFEIVKQGPEWLRNQVGDPVFRATDKVVAVMLQGEKFGDVDLACIDELTDVERLYLDNSLVTDAGLQNLRGMSELRILDLGGTRVTDSGLSHLGGLKKLECIFLDGSGVTSDGLVYLMGLPSLGELYLAGTQVDDGALDTLKGMSSLKYLSIGQTRITDAAIADLRRIRPDLEVVR
jgi:hypothetical protein